MPGMFRSIGASFGRTVKGFSVAQRTIAVIGVAAVVLGAVALGGWLLKPQYSPLFSGLAPADASAVVDQLQSDGVTYQLTDGGATILVPQDQVYAERLKAAAAGLPSSNEGGYSLLDKMGVTASEFQQNVTYKRAIEGELAKTISAMDGVQTASVQLAIPEKSVFVSEEKDPTASVFVQTRAGATLTDQQVQAVVHLTSAAVEGMQPTDVSVVDAKGHVLSSVGSGAVGGADQQAGDYDDRVRTQVQALLDKVVGPGNSSVVVAASMNQNSGTKTTESYSTPTSGPVALNESSSKETYGDGSGSGSGATGVLGPDNIAVPNSTIGQVGSGNSTDSTTTSGSSGYGNESVTKNNAVDKTTETTSIPAGAIDRQTISVAVDKKAAAGVDLTNLQDLVANAAGVDRTRGDSVRVAAVDFNTDAAKQAQKALKAADAQAASSGMFEAIKTGGTALAIALVVIIGFIILARRSRRPQREDVDLGELDSFGQAQTFTVPLAQAGALDPSDPRAAVAAGGAAGMAAVGGPAAPQYPVGEAMPVASGAAADRRRADLQELASTDPARTADLLRGMLDDRSPV